MVASIGSLISDPGSTSNLLASFKFPSNTKLTMSRREEQKEMSTQSERHISEGSGPDGKMSTSRDSTFKDSTPAGEDIQPDYPSVKDKPAYLIRWNRFEEQVCNAFAELFCSDSFVDVTLACEGDMMKAHKIVLAMSSPFFRRIFQENPCKHPVVIIKGVTSKTLRSILQYLYLGEVILSKHEINSFMDAADYLSICGVLPNLYSCDISTTNTTEDHETHQGSESEDAAKTTDQGASRMSDNEESLVFRDSAVEDTQTVAQTKVIKYHGVKSRWTRRYSNTSFHGTPTTSSPVQVEHKRSASAGEIEMLSENAETIPLPESQIGKAKSVTTEPPLIDVTSDVEMPGATDEDRYDVYSNIPENAESRLSQRKIIQRAYPRNYNANFDDSSDTQMEDWRSQTMFSPASQFSTSNMPTSSVKRSLRPAPYSLGSKDFSHPLQVSVDSHPPHSYSTSSSTSTSYDYPKPKSHSSSYPYSSSQSLPSQRTMFRSEAEVEFPSVSTTPSTLLASREDRSIKYRLSAGPSSSTASSYRHSDYSRSLSLLSTQTWSFPDTRARSHFEDTSSRDEERFRSESVEGGRFTSFSGAKELMTHTGHLSQHTSISSKSHSFPSTSDMSASVSHRYALGLMSQLRSPSSATTTTSTRPKTKAIRSSQVPQSARYTAAEVDQMVDAVANYPGNIVPCTLCQKFVKRERLRAHIHECHLLTGEKIICPHCGIALKSKGSFRVHIWRHKRGALPTRNSMTDFGKGPPSPSASGPASH